MLKKKIKDEKEEIESFYALLGFLLLIIAFLGGCFFGKVSLFIKMIVAFVVGDWYPIFLFMLLMYGIYLIVVRRPIDFFLEKYIGIYAIVISVLIISQIPFIKNMSSIDIEHFKLIEDTQLVVYRTINNIFNLWELEIFTLNFNLGGGVLAAFFSSLLVCFFTSKGAIAVAIAVIVFSLGTYILSFIKEKKKNKKKLAEAIIIEKRDNFEKIDEDKNIPEEEKTEASKVESIIEEKKDELTEELEEPLYDEILDLIVEEDEVSIAFLQEKFRLGYNRALRCMTLLEKNGIVGPETESKTRKVLLKQEKKDLKE